MKFLTLFSFLILLNATSVLAQEICEDEKNSIIELSEDVKKADQKMKMKSLMKWYKTNVEAEEDDSPYMVTDTIVDMSLNDCTKSSDFMGMKFVMVNPGCENSKTHQKLVTPLKKGEKKSNNKFLAQIFSKKDGKILLVDEIPAMFSGKTFIVHKKLKDGRIVQYSINTGVNPALNPVQVIDETKKKAQTSVGQKTGFVGAGFSMNNGIGW